MATPLRWLQSWFGFLPIFSGYGVDAIAVRLQDADAKAINKRAHDRLRTVKNV